MHLRSLALPLLALLCAPLPAARSAAPPAAPPAASQAAPRPVLLTWMKQELDRSMARLRLRGYEAPYFISYTLRDVEQAEVSGKLGAVFAREHQRRRVLHVEVRVGGYELDNTSADERESALDDVGLNLSEVDRDAPLDDEDLHALRGPLWLLTDQKYKQALAAYARKRARRVTAPEEDDKLASFSRERPQRHISPIAPLQVNLGEMAATVRKAGARLTQAPLLDGEVKLAAESQVRYYVSSEGTEVVEQRVLYSGHVSAQARARDGMLLTNERDFYGRAPADLPDAAALTGAVDGLAEDLRRLLAAPAADPYNGPAILMEEAAGVFFHETIGHRLEGERQQSEQEGRTFKGQVGKPVLPDFLSVIDDPTLVRAPGAGQPLNGFYRFDDEGVPARPVTLVERGVLRDYLKSRTPILGSPRSNGHGRAEGTADPIGRMANLIVQSSRRLPMAELKARLLAEVRRQGKPYGLIIRDILGGSTNTASIGSQTFRGQPTLVYRVDAQTGAESLVRGVEMVGTPLSSVAKIVATSDTVGIFNGFCGAESGMVPVSTVAPAVLFTEIELQRAQRTSERPPILPPPWRDDAGAAPRSAPAPARGGQGAKAAR